MSQTKEEEGEEAEKKYENHKLPFGLQLNESRDYEDFIMMAECSESCGPMPLFTIPSQGLCSVLDINQVAVRVMSTDHQTLGVKGRIPEKDTVLFVGDIIAPNYSAVISYSVLLDTQARGFVRPFCVAYFSQDRIKLIQNLKQIMEVLSNAVQAIGITNREIFLHEIQSMINSRKSRGSSRESLGELNIEQLENFKDIVERVVAMNSKLRVALRSLLDRLMSLPKYLFSSSLYSAFRLSENSQNLPSKSQCAELRPLVSICLGGLFLGLYQLHIIYKYYRRKSEHIALLSEAKKFKGNCLKFGACLKVSKKVDGKVICEDYDCSLVFPNIPISPEVDLEFDHVDLDYLALLTNFSFDDLPTNENIDLAPSAPWKVEGKACPWHGYTLDRVWDVMEYLTVNGAEEHLKEMFSLISSPSNILYSLLVSRPIVFVGSPEQQNLVKNVVISLGSFALRNSRHLAHMEPWRVLPISADDAKNLNIVGLCLDNETDLADIVPPTLLGYFTLVDLTLRSYAGPKYSGLLLADFDKRWNALPSGSTSILSFLVSTLADIEFKSQFWHLFTQCLGSVREPSAYFLRKGYSTNDIFIFQNFDRFLLSNDLESL